MAPSSFSSHKVSFKQLPGFNGRKFAIYSLVTPEIVKARIRVTSVSPWNPNNEILNRNKGQKHGHPQKGHLSWGLSFSAPTVRESQVRPPTYVADCNPVTLKVYLVSGQGMAQSFSLTRNNLFAAVDLRKSSISFWLGQKWNRTRIGKFHCLIAPSPLKWLSESRWGDWVGSACPQTWATLKPKPTGLLLMVQRECSWSETHPFVCPCTFHHAGWDTSW